MLTGVGSSLFKENIYGIPTHKVDEFKAIGLGGLALSNKKEGLIISMGTGTAFVRADKDGIRHIGGSGVGGGTVLGLCGRLCNARSFETVVEMAHKGDLKKVDLNISDISAGDISTLTPDATASNFGKMTDGVTPEDLARGVLNMVFQTIGMLAVFACRQDGIKDVIVTGTLSTVPCANVLFKQVSGCTKSNLLFRSIPFMPRPPERRCLISLKTGRKMNADKNSYKKSSFGPAFLFLCKRRREALAVYYAFCRLMDDIADEPDVKDRLAELALWREEITRAFNGEAKPRWQRHRRMAPQYGMTQDRFLLLIEGMEADVQGRVYKNFEELQWYLWRVAGIVGLATLDILGIKGPHAQELASALGFAVQLTNIVRDVHEDTALGRVYLPEDLLAKHGLTRQDVLQNQNPARLAAALAELAQKDKDFYRRAWDVLHTLPARKILPCRVMGFVYRANLAKIEKTGFEFERAVRLSKTEKALQCIYALYKTDLAV